MYIDNEKMTTSSPPIKLSLPLQFQQDIYHLLRAEDVLVILAQGLGLLKIVSNLLHSYDAAGNSLIIVVGAEERENTWLGESLVEHNAVSRSPLAKGLRLINTERASVAKREQIYAQGGVVSVTSRILVVDLLSRLLDPETVTGLIVLHAERVIATSTEAFITRLYRQSNKIGFLKAFSDTPEPFTSGFSPLANLLGNLFLRKPSLWPRFHVTVAESLEGKKRAEVIELEVPMTEAMKTIQTAIMECVEASIADLRKANSSLEMDDWTLDSALHRNFDAIIRRQLDPVWHRVSPRSKQIVGDLSVLRTMLSCLLSYDCVSFLRYLDTILAAHSSPPGSNRQNQSPWLFLDAANTIFQTARARVYSGKVDDRGVLPTSNLPDTLRPVLEEQPKWECLSGVLEEIERDIHFGGSGHDSTNTTLIMCNDQPTCRQLREYLESMHLKTRIEESGPPHEEAEKAAKASGEFMLRRKLREYLVWRRHFAKVSASLFDENQRSMNDIKTLSHPLRGKGPPNKRRRLRGGLMTTDPHSPSSHKDVQISTLLASIAPDADIPDPNPDPEMEVLSDSFFNLLPTQSSIIIHPYTADHSDSLLEELSPTHIITFSPSAPFIRRIELHRSSHTARPVKVFFLYYGHSVEEASYLSAVRREKDAFTSLIRERGAMALTLAAPFPSDAGESLLRTVNTRIAGGGRLSATAVTPTIVADTREFRAALPSLLHGKGMNVVPCQLTVADYVLAPTIGVERKSVRDLIASFRDGRVVGQAETLLRSYKTAVLLVEFDVGRGFGVEGFGEGIVGAGGAGGSRGGSGPVKVPDADSRDLQAKIALLVLAFPRLKVVWSSSPYQTVEIFAELKKGLPEPDPVAAVQMGLELVEAGERGAGAEADERTFSVVPGELLRRIPGLKSKEVGRLLLETGSVTEVANMSVQELDPLVGREAGRKVYRFFNRRFGDGGLNEG